jgi:hypothetical protein
MLEDVHASNRVKPPPSFSSRILRFYNRLLKSIGSQMNSRSYQLSLPSNIPGLLGFTLVNSPRFCTSVVQQMAENASFEQDEVNEQREVVEFHIGIDKCFAVTLKSSQIPNPEVNFVYSKQGRAVDARIPRDAGYVRIRMWCRGRVLVLYMLCIWALLHVGTVKGQARKL